MKLSDDAPATVKADPRYQQTTYVVPGSKPQAVPEWNLDGVAWLDAPAPPRRHKHWAQSVGSFTELGGEVWRCPCGAIGGPLERWLLLDKQRTAPGWVRRAWVAVTRGENNEKGGTR